MSREKLAQITADIVACRRCPRLVAWRERVAREKVARFRDAYIAAAVRCAPPANKPTPVERATCQPFLVRELAALERVRVVVALGAIAWESAFRTIAALTGDDARPRPRFGHGTEARAGGYVVIGSYHPSQQNTFTGRLTQPMLDAVLGRARSLAAAG
jgi:uracil-DNA glycosylase family 4